MMPLIIDSGDFRRVLGHYPTGVCAITAMANDNPVGMIVGSFTSVSLDPPLVAFLPDRKSASWPLIEATGKFCVNVLSTQQQHVCRALTSRAENKFEALSYRLSGSGLPILDGIVASIDCRLIATHEAGDHYIAIGEVQALNVESSEAPLIFLQGRYGSFSPASA